MGGGAGGAWGSPLQPGRWRAQSFSLAFRDMSSDLEEDSIREKQSLFLIHPPTPLFLLAANPCISLPLPGYLVLWFLA